MVHLKAAVLNYKGPQGLGRIKDHDEGGSQNCMQSPVLVLSCSIHNYFKTNFNVHYIEKNTFKRLFIAIKGRLYPIKRILFTPPP